MPPYQPYYCEENAWHQARLLAEAGREPTVLFITNPNRQVLFFGQRAAGPEGWLIWDYHVVVLCDGQIYDPDSVAGPTLTAHSWLDLSFRPQLAEPRYHPIFRAVPWPELRAHFTTDRSHMRDAEGRWLKPPPPWPPPTAPHHPITLNQLLDLERTYPGEVLTLSNLYARLSIQ